MALAAMVVLGASMFPLYSLTIAYTNDWLKVEQILGASATLVRVNGTGAVLGPLVAAGLMAAFGPRYLFLSLAGALAAIAAYVLYRIVAKDPLPLDQQYEYVGFPARASSGAAKLIPRRRRG
jgi:MFS family permease